MLNVLSSKNSSDALQTDLFDLLGFERIELVQELLEHRQDIVAASAKTKDSVRREIVAAAASRTLMPMI